MLETPAREKLGLPDLHGKSAPGRRLNGVFQLSGVQMCFLAGRRRIACKRASEVVGDFVAAGGEQHAGDFQGELSYRWSSCITGRPTFDLLRQGLLALPHPPLEKYPRKVKTRGMLNAGDMHERLGFPSMCLFPENLSQSTWCCVLVLAFRSYLCAGSRTPSVCW